MECVLEKSCLMFDEESIYNYSGKLIKILNKGRYLNNSGVTLYEDDEVPHREHPFSEVKGSMKSRFYTDEEMLHVANAKEYVKSRLVIQDDIDIINQINPITLDCIITYVLGILFNNYMHGSGKDYLVRLATIIDKLDSTVRAHVEIKSARSSEKNQEKSAAAMDETQKSKNYSSKKAASSKRKAASSAKMNDSSDKIDSSSDKEKVVPNNMNQDKIPANNIDEKDKLERSPYNIGTLLLAFLLDKGVVKLINDNYDHLSGF